MALFEESTSCPFCDSLNVRRSHQRLARDWMAALILLRAFRCRDCYQRYYDLVWRKPEPTGQHKAA
jgi:hypothetical protein